MWYTGLDILHDPLY